MPAQTQSNIPTWDPQELLEIISPATGNFCCAGYTKRNRRCTKPIAKDNRYAALVLLAGLPQIYHDERRLRAHLRKLAGFALCRYNHQNQIDETAADWYDVITEALAAEAAGSEPPFDDLEDEIARLQRQLDELRRRQEEQRRREDEAESRRQEEERRQQEQAQRQAEETARREEEHQRAEAHRREEEAREREEEARREQEEASRRQEEARRQREARQRADAQARADRERRQRETLAREWTESWARYDRDWEHMQRLDTSRLDEDVRDSVPWPVKSGRWQDINDANVRAFFRHAPDGAAENPRRFRSVLRRQALRWHEDRLRHHFPRIAGDEGSLRLANLVMQAVNSLTGTLSSL